MKKQLLLLCAICGLSYGAAIAQNADDEQLANNDSTKLAISNQVHSIPQTTFNETANHVYGSCTATTMCPQLTTNTGNVRGYYFIAPVSFTICGLFIPT